jgi:DNA-binding MarR family transcriptional regulator
MTAVTSIMRAEQILMGRLNELLKPFSLTFPRYEALMLLYFSREGSLPLGKMGQRLQVHPTSVTNIVDGLEALGFAERGSVPADRRQRLARITEAGRATATEATAVLNRAKFGTAPLAAADLDRLTTTLRSLRADVDGFDLDRR